MMGMWRTGMYAVLVVAVVLLAGTEAGRWSVDRSARCAVCGLVVQTAMTSAADLHDSTSYRQPEYLFMAMFEEACAPDSAASRWARQTELVIDDSQEDAGPLLDLIVHPEEESMCGPVCEMLLRACNHVVEEVLDDPELGTKLWSSSSYALRAQLSASISPRTARFLSVLVLAVAICDRENARRVSTSMLRTPWRLLISTSKSRSVSLLHAMKWKTTLWSNYISTLTTSAKAEQDQSSQASLHHCSFRHFYPTIISLPAN